MNLTAKRCDCCCVNCSYGRFVGDDDNLLMTWWTFSQKGKSESSIMTISLSCAICDVVERKDVDEGPANVLVRVYFPSMIVGLCCRCRKAL